MKDIITSNDVITASWDDLTDEQLETRIREATAGAPLAYKSGIGELYELYLRCMRRALFLRNLARGFNGD